MALHIAQSNSYRFKNIQISVAELLLLLVGSELYFQAIFVRSSLKKLNKTRKQQTANQIKNSQKKTNENVRF